MRRDSDEIFHKDQVITIDGRPALITNVGGDGTTNDTTTIRYGWIDAAGRIGPGGYFNAWQAESKKVRVVDFAKVETVVHLPPEWAKAAAAYDAPPELHKASEEWEPERHPSYGVVKVGRVSGFASLFMSPFRHQHYMTLTVQRAAKHRSLAEDKAFSNTELISIALSEAQWARMVSSPGGEGTPCTIQSIGYTQMPDAPAQAQVERFHTDVEKRIAEAVTFLDDATKKANDLLASPSATKAQRKEVADALKYARKKLDDSLPWIARQMRESMATIVEDGKIELEAHFNRTVERLGLKAEKPPIELPSASGKETP